MADAADKDAIASDVVKSGVVTLAQFRALTSACREGVRRHLDGLGIDLDSLEDMPLSEAAEAMSGTSYGDTFLQHIAKAGGRSND